MTFQTDFQPALLGKDFPANPKNAGSPEKGGGENEGRPNRREDGERAQETDSGKKPERGYSGIPTERPGSQFGPAIGRFTGIVQRRRCGFGECRRVARGRKRV